MRYTKDFLLQSLKRFYIEKGRVPIANDFCNDTKYPSVATIIRYFESWNNAIRDAGLWDNRITVRITDDKLLYYMKQFYKENGRTPTHYDFNNNPNYPSFGTYIERFGSWNNALREAGLWHNRVIVRMTDGELLEYLMKFYEENGRIPTCYDFNSDPNYPNVATYQKRFGSWNKALKAGSLQVSRFTKMTNEELLEYLKMFYEENGRSPVVHDFINNHKYPNLNTYMVGRKL